MMVMPLQEVDHNMKMNDTDIKGQPTKMETHTLCLVMLRTWTISGVSYKKQPRPLSHIRSSLYFS